MIKSRITNELNFLLKTGIAFGGSLVLTFVLSQVLGEFLQKKELEMLGDQQELSRAMLELIGMQELRQFPAELEVFFLIIMVLNLVVMGTIIGHSVHAMRQSTEQGAFGFLFMQVTKKYVYFVIEVVRILLVALLTWGIYVIGIFAVGGLFTNGAGSSVVVKVNTVLLEMTTRGIGIVFLLVALSISYGVKQSYSMHGVDFGLVIMGVSFVLGNIYKIPQVIGQNQIEQMENAQQTMEVMRMMKQLRFMCPSAWLNPFNIYNSVVDAGMVWNYAGVGVIVFAAAGVWFCQRDWWEV